jgi:putative tricarboxylic transport membrane protein
MTIRFVAMQLALLLIAAPAAAQESISFKGKTIAMIVGSPAGGGTDATGRLIAPFLSRYLTGNPTVIVRNVPGADGVVAFNYFVQQAKPDGLTAIAGGGPDIDPLRYRVPQAHYDPVKFEYVGGAGRGGTTMVIKSAAVRRLYDRAAPPVTMGIVAAIPRSGELIAAWGIGFLGWHAKWITGYPGTNALMLALQQGEIDMTATANLFALREPIASGSIKVLVQSGTLQNGRIVPRPEFADVPLLSDELVGRMNDPIAVKSFNYWRAVTLVDKFLALPPGTPGSIVEVYRKAYREIAADPQFATLGRKISEVFTPLSDRDVTSQVEAVAATPADAIGYLDTILRRQGLSGL